MKGRFYDLGELLYDRRTKLEACQSHRERTSQLTRQRQISWKVLFLSRSSCLIKEICWLIWKVSRESMHDDFIWPYRKYWIVTPSFTSQSYIRSMIRIFTKLRSKGTNFFRISQFCNLSSADRPTIDWTARKPSSIFDRDTASVETAVTRLWMLLCTHQSPPISLY